MQTLELSALKHLGVCNASIGLQLRQNVAWDSRREERVEDHMQKTVLASGERIDCDHGCYIEALPPFHGHSVYRSCGPNCGMAIYSETLEQAMRDVSYLQIGH